MRTVLLRQRDVPEFPGATPETDLIAIDQPVDSDRLRTITTAQLWAPRTDPFERLPALLAQMPALVSLTISGSSMSGDAITRMQDSELPAGLEELHVLVETGKVLRWPDIRLPGLRALTVVGEFRFDTSAFPALEHLSFRPDRQLRTLRQALELPLTSINLQAVPTDETIFAELARRPLRFLGLHGGTKLTTLTGITDLQMLTSLQAKNLRNLADLAALRELPHIERLDIQYCTSIENIEVINDLSSLQQLTLVGCGNVGLDRIIRTIERLPKHTIGTTS
ncbi:hypothetical protein [Streptomyces sp. NRRL F-5630]|uniref:hypothetical protein n=1 Tax=Streptomyces sp. NRRL F-5630 TaxID=1463864 RepID=UPI003EBB677D